MNEQIPNWGECGHFLNTRPQTCALAATVVVLLAALNACSGSASGGSSLPAPPPGNQNSPMGQLAVTPNPISFGTIVVGQNGTLTVTVNNSGTASITLSSAAVDNSSFIVTGLSLPETFPAGGQAGFQVSFTPPATGASSGTLTMTPYSGSAVTIPMSGYGGLATLMTLPETLAFGEVGTGASAEKSVTLENTGNADLDVTQLAISGEGFSLARPPTLPLTVLPGKGYAVTVKFAPQASGSAPGALSIVSDATGGAASVALSGTGVLLPGHSSALFWQTGSSAPAGYNVYRGTVSGGPYSKLNGSLVPDTTYKDSSVVAGSTYFYVVTEVDSSGNESPYSNETKAVIPSP